jgi:hypothetical protein
MSGFSAIQSAWALDIHMRCWGRGQERTEKEYASPLEASGWRFVTCHYFQASNLPKRVLCAGRQARRHGFLFERRTIADLAGSNGRDRRKLFRHIFRNSCDHRLVESLFGAKVMWYRRKSCVCFGGDFARGDPFEEECRIEVEIAMEPNLRRIVKTEE